MRRQMVNHQVRQEFELLPQRSVLLVDDDPNDLAHHTAVLSSQGQSVFPCSSFEEGESLAESGKFDLVAVSQGGANFRGRSVVEAATRRGSPPPVVVLADVIDMDLYLESMQIGALDYLRKPVASDDFRRVLKVIACLTGACDRRYRASD